MALRALRGNEFKAVDLHELPLERRGDVVGYRVRARAGIIRLHGNHRIVHDGQIVDRETQVSEDAEDDYGHRQNGGHDRLAYEWLG
jgi:hypothetical protein